jgi:hypothetical protein
VAKYFASRWNVLEQQSHSQKRKTKPINKKENH